MGELRQTLKSILLKVEKKRASLEQFKKFFLPEEYKHFYKMRVYQNKIIFYLDSPLLRYRLNLKKEEILKKIKKEGYNFSEIFFKV